MLLSCKKQSHAGRVNPEAVVTMKSEDLGMTVSRNGLKSYRFVTPLMEQYDLASDPYTKYPNGIYVETFQDSTEIVESTLKANEAIYYQKRKLWMASGNVIATGSGNTLYTEQLFWDEKTDRVYSNVKVRVVDQDGEHHGEGFESDVNFETWVMRDYEGTLVLDTTPSEAAGSDGGEENEKRNESFSAEEDTGSTPAASSAPRVVVDPGWSATQEESRPLKVEPRGNETRTGVGSADGNSADR